MSLSFPSRPLGGFLLSALLVFGLVSKAEAGPYAALVAEIESDRVLYEQNANELRHPASLTKMMTLYMLFEALSQGRLQLTDPMVASAHAVSKPPSRLGLKVGDTLMVEDGILALVTQSANDAATVIAETLGGTEEVFAGMMTQKARQLGMSNTVFRNAQGLPDPDQWTTAWDMYRLGKALIKNYPQYYRYFATEVFPYQGRDFHNHNHLLGKVDGVDGIKTGFINSSGFNLVASVQRNGVRLIGVVFGGPTHSRRDAHMKDILEDGYAQLAGNPPSVHLASFDPPPPAPRTVQNLPSADTNPYLGLAQHHAAAPAKPHHQAAAPVASHAHTHAHAHAAHETAKPIKLASAAEDPKSSKASSKKSVPAAPAKPSAKPAHAVHTAAPAKPEKAAPSHAKTKGH
jgi:D-alanyl-D-alanine carboxypeptidase